MWKYVICMFTALGMFVQPGFSQSLPVDVVQSIEPIIPEYYGNGSIRYIVEGENLLRQGRFEEALLAYDNALVLDPYFAEGYIKRAAVKFRLGRRTEANLDYRQAFRLNPYAADLHGYGGPLSRIRLLASGSDSVDADWYVPAGEENFLPESEYRELLQQVSNLKTSGSVAAALYAVNRAITRHGPRDYRLFKMRGNLYVLLDDFQRAIADYNYAITLNGDYREAYFNRGLANLLANNRPDACSDIEKSIWLGYEEGTEKLRYFCGF